MHIQCFIDPYIYLLLDSDVRVVQPWFLYNLLQPKLSLYLKVKKNHHFFSFWKKFKPFWQRIGAVGKVGLNP